MGAPSGVAFSPCPQTDAELEALRKSVKRGTGNGSEGWRTRIANGLGLNYSYTRAANREKK